jgi:hypothetical protein
MDRRLAEVGLETLCKSNMVIVPAMRPRKRFSSPISAFAAPLLCAATLVAGCAPALRDPETTLHAYARALEEGRADDAYRMLSEEARRGMSIEAFRRLVRESRDDVKEIGQALSRPTSAPLVTATLTTPSGQEMELLLENGAWRVDATAIDLYAQDTPRHAVMGFVRALERKRYDILLRYVPDAHKEGLDAAKLKTAWEGHDKDEMDQVLTSLRQALPGAAIEEAGDSAQMPYGPGVMRFVREHGVWKIEDFD